MSPGAAMDFCFDNRARGVAFDNAPCMIAVLDVEHRVLMANPAFRETFGEERGGPCFELLKGRDTPCESCGAALCFADGVAHTSEEEGRTSADRLIYYRVQSIPLTSKTGDVRYVLQIATDETRRHELEKGLDQAERLANVGMTAAGLAHTIKNILAGLEGANYAMETGLEQRDTDRLAAGWRMVSEYLEQLGGLVRGLLSYSKPRQPHKELLDPRELLAGMIELFAKKAALAEIEIVTHVDPDVGTAMLDRESIHAALCNLITNAIDACTWDPDSDKIHKIEVSALSLDAGGVRFQVRDNGMGISQENQRRILADSFTTKGMRGTGLGLLLTKKAAQEHDGAVSFESRFTEGSVFRIDIPTPQQAL